MAQFNTAPEQVQLMEQPAGTVPGLEPLLHASHLIVKEKKDMAEMFFGFERNNRYEIYNEAGQMILYAAEESSALWRCFCSAIRPFTIRIFDAQRRQCIVLRASINCFTQTVSIEVPEGRCIAFIYREFALLLPTLYIQDATGAVMFKIKSPLSAAIGSFGNVKFDVLSADGQTVVGQISKQWGGLAKEMYTSADTFGISLPADMDVTWKAVLLAAVFHVDFTFYQTHN